MKHTKSQSLLSLLLVLAMLATCLVAFSVTSSAEDAESSWNYLYTEPTTLDEDGETILVNTAAEFAWITWNPDLATGSYRLMTNVNMISVTNKTSSTDTSKVFSGTLDGNGHYVRNVVDKGGSGYGASGLFRNVSGTIKNLTIKDSTFSAAYNTDVAAFVAKSLTGTLENCHVVNCTISGASAAGFAGNCAGTIKDCTIDATTTITGSTSNYAHVVGGICGKISSTGAVVENCIVNGSISGTSIVKNASAGSYLPATVGGIIGSVAIDYNQYQWNGLKNCVNNATITATHLDNAPGGGIGGLIGEITRISGNTNAGVAQVTATGCVNNGAITVDTANSGAGVGGLVGQANRGALVAIDCVNTGDVSAPASIHVGGLLGYSKGGANTNDYGTDIFRNCGQYGTVTGAGNVGSAVGCTYQSTTLENIVLAGSVTLSESAAADALTGAVIAFQTANTANSKTLSDCTVTMNGVYSPVTAAVYNIDTAATGELVVVSTSVVTGDAFTSGTIADFVTALNDAATANGWHKWAAAAAPLYIVFKGDAVQVILDGATLSLGDTMTLKLFVKASSVSEIADLATIVVNDGTKDYAGALDATAENYVFEIAGLLAKDMGTAKTYTVKYTLASDTANPITCDTGVTYSPLQYAINMYKKNNGADTNFAALLTSMVRYMDAAGATDAMTAFASATGYEFGDTTDAYTAIVNKDKDSTYTLTSGTAELGAELTSGIILLVNPADGLTLTSVKIGDAELTITSVEGIWRVNGINPGDLYNELTFTFTNAADETVTGTYSVARYLDSYVGTASETLAKATALYMDAFTTYATMR
ncbi:MAG: hypothetical protein ACI3XE_00045 [Eubacteriales bacterium]